MAHNPVIKKNIKENAEIKTMSDLTLFYQCHLKLTIKEAIAYAKENYGGDLWKRLYQRNVDLFTTGAIVILN